MQVERTLTTGSLADAAVEFALVDEFLQARFDADERARVRYECVARSGDLVLGWNGVKLPGKVTSTRPGLQGRFEEQVERIFLAENLASQSPSG